MHGCRSRVFKIGDAVCMRVVVHERLGVWEHWPVDHDTVDRGGPSHTRARMLGWSGRRPQDAASAGSRGRVPSKE